VTDLRANQIFDLIIVGGGIGGAALGAAMAGAGCDVLILEKSEVFHDEVRGEWIAPWGVAETRRLGLYDVLIAAGGHCVNEHVTYDELLAPSEAEAKAIPLEVFVPDVRGPLCLGHPRHCQTLFNEAKRRGAMVHRGVDVTRVVAGPAPEVAFTLGDEPHRVRARLVVGADGRNSMVREAAGVTLHADKPHHIFGGMLVENVPGWDERRQAIGTEGDFAFLAFPQGGGRLRVYGSYSLEQRRRFAGPDGPQRFLDAFRMNCSPANALIADGQAAGPLRSYFNNDSWTDAPFAEGVVLVGDAAGWNDPINGLGLSITYRDVRIVSDLLLSTDDWTPALFVPYGQERRERMRRLRFVGAVQSVLDAEFTEAARERRRGYFERASEDPSLRSHVVALMAGPEAVAADAFTPDYWARVVKAEFA